MGLPVSSSGVKSYVDSNYVPLSATQAPVTGLTDILTPVNLLPNSDFSRSGEINYVPTLTWASITDTSKHEFSYNCYFGRTSVTASNVSITRETNNIRIQGTLASSDGETWENGCIWIDFPLKLKANVAYTISTNITDNINTIVKTGMHGIGSTQTIYSNNDVINYVRVFSTSVEFNDYGGIIFYLRAGTDVPFDFTIHNWTLYEGEFKNPPSKRSLDNYARFMLYDEINSDRYLLNELVMKDISAGWKRLALINRMVSGTGHGIIITGGTYQHRYPSLDKIMITVTQRGSSVNIVNVKAERLGTGQMGFDKYRIVKIPYNNSNWFVLEGYISGYDGTSSTERLYIRYGNESVSQGGGGLGNIMMETKYLLPIFENITPTETYSEVTPIDIFS